MSYTVLSVGDEREKSEGSVGTRAGLWILYFQCGAVLLLLWRQFSLLWPERWVQDDAYVSFRYARNLVEGNGLVYNAGARVEGYTNFLWTLLSAIPLALGADDPLPFMHLLGAFLWGASYWLLLSLGVRLWARGLWAAPLAVIPLACHWSYNMWFFSGMETPLVSFLTVAALLLVVANPLRHTLAPFLASLCGVLLAMTRADGLVTGAGLAVAAALLHGRQILRQRLWLRGVVLPILPFLFLFVPYTLWRWSYYGSILPNTYYAKAAYLTFYTRGWTYLTTYLTTYGLLVFLPLLVLGCRLGAGQLAGRFVAASLMTGLFVAFYVIRLGGDFMEWRFLTPVSGVVIPALVIAAAISGRWLRSALDRGAAPRPSVAPPETAAWLTGAAAAAAVTLTLVAARPAADTSVISGQETIPLLRRYADPGLFDWRAVGRLLDDVLPAGATIATTSAGIIPYFCDRPCLDLHGLTDAQIARQPIETKRGSRVGHEHWLQDIDEIRQRGVDVMLPWAEPNPYPRALATRPEANSELVSVRAPDGGYVDFTILNPAAFDREALRADERIVFFGDEPVVDKRLPYTRKEHFAHYEIVDSLDWGDDSSETSHLFSQYQARDSPYSESWHTKLLHYRPPLEKVFLEDQGRRIYGHAVWEVRNVSAERRLVLLVRHDRTGGGEYELEVNDRPVRRLLRARSGGEAWDEEVVVIPADVLEEGRNLFRMTRSNRTERDSEFYYMWFLQETGQPSSASVGPDEA